MGGLLLVTHVISIGDDRREVEESARREPAKLERAAR
jgi:hypothetical protein